MINNKQKIFLKFDFCLALTSAPALLPPVEQHSSSLVAHI